jgi:hypothetical protein
MAESSCDDEAEIQWLNVVDVLEASAPDVLKAGTAADRRGSALLLALPLLPQQRE